MTGPSIPPTPPAPNAPSPTKGQVVQIVSLPESLQNNARAIRLEGEVVRQNEDGSLRVRTAEGDIDIAFRGRQPQPGQRLEIDVPPGSPPRNVTVRPAPQPQTQPPPQTQTAPQPAQPQTPPPQTPQAQIPKAPAQTGQAPAEKLPAPSPQPQAQPAQTKPAPPQPQTPAPQTTLPKPETISKPGFLPVENAPVKPNQITGTQPSPINKLGNPQQIQQFSSAKAPATGIQNTAAALPAIQIPAKTGETIRLTPFLPNNPVGPSKIPDTTVIKSTGTLFSTVVQAIKNFLPPTTLSAPAQPATPASSALSTSFAPPIVLTGKILGITPPSAPLPAMAPALSSAAPPIALAVVSLTPDQKPIVQIPSATPQSPPQNFVLQVAPNSVSVGSTLTIQPQSFQFVQAPAPSVSAPSAPLTPPIGAMQNLSALPPAWRPLIPLMQAGTLWPVMDELFQAFYQTTPQAAQILGRVIPSPTNPAAFGPALLVFMAAAKSGDLQAWLGEKKTDMLQKLGKGGLMQRLSGEAAQMASAPDAATGDWKSFPIPLLWQNEISKVVFHVRKESDDAEQDNSDGATRFILDLSLTRMGEVQLDGMVRGSRLDLIVRTELPISSSMQDAMRTAYAKALDGTNIFGDIGFQSERKGWESILKKENTFKTFE